MARLDDIRWRDMKRALRAKLQEDLGQTLDMSNMDNALQEYWEFMNDPVQVEAYLKPKRLPALEEQKAKAEAALAELNKQIDAEKAADAGVGR